MCYLCLKDNPFDVIDAYVKKQSKTANAELIHRIELTKQFFESIKRDEEEFLPRCHIGDGLIERMKEERIRLQYLFARQF